MNGTWTDYGIIDKKQKPIMKKIFKFITSKKRTKNEKYCFLEEIELACNLQKKNFE